MALLSSFELIAQPIIPPNVAPSGLPNPTSVEAYFLTLTNILGSSSQVTLTFAVNPPVNNGGVIEGSLNGGGIVPSGVSKFGPVSAFLDFVRPFPLLSGFTIASGGGSAQARFSLPSSGTVLFLLQPDISPLASLTSESEFFSYETRGFVDIVATSGSRLLCSPTLRGTFLELGDEGELLGPKILTSMAKDDEEPEELSLQAYSQQAYPLQTASGPLYTF
ncbi:hypothetical protein ACSYAD_31735 [Acaryochloris marina NIES-2412]|uniref:hypothetical protein n=1 Tax=Acaryochloris marina TaxID=155978 RepID=UPI00405842D1